MAAATNGQASANPTKVENEHAPPSSAEEAAALLGAAIGETRTAASSSSLSSTTHSSSGDSQANPPVGMHSIFTVQTPVPNGVLFIRLCNLRAWLRWHVDAMDSLSEDLGGLIGDESPMSQAFGNKIKQSQSNEQFTAARSILAVLMKLLEVSSSLSTGDGNNGNNGDASSNSSSNKSKLSSANPKQKQHKPLAPLLSTPLRNTWVECISLCIALGSSLPGNLRTDAYTFVGKMMEISNWNPRSRMAAGGVRLAALQVIGRICTFNTDLAKRIAPYSWEILQCCHKGLLSGGAGEPGHRAACVKVACSVAISCRNGENGESFSVPGAMEEKAVVEAIKFIKRATSDKYPEVRMGAAVFAGLIAPMLIRNLPFGGSSRGGGGRDGDDSASPLAWLEDVAQVALRNIDDESAGVATAWATALARCICASVEHGKGVRDAQSEDQASRRSADVDDEAPSSSDSNLDLAAKFKAFSESRRASAATSVCSSVPSAIGYIVRQFVKCGGEVASNKCGGSYSCGGRAARIGFSDTLTEFLRLQAAKGDFQLTGAVKPVLEMVGVSFEKQVMKAEKGGNFLSSERDFYAPSTPHSSPEKKVQSTISGAFLARNSKMKSSGDSSIGRLLASSVLRKGISENLSESSQLNVLRELTAACTCSVNSSTDGTDATRSTNVESTSLNRHQIQVALTEISHLVVAVGEAGASSLEDILTMVENCLSHSDHGVRYEAAIVYAAIAQAFPAEGRKFVINSLSGVIAKLDEIQHLSQVVASISSPAPKSRFRRTVPLEKSGSVDELMKSQCILHGNALAVSMLMHEFPHIMGGVAAVIVGKVFEVSGKLLDCQFNESFVKTNPIAACTCIRAGYCMLSGALTMGTEAVVPHITKVFTCWQNSSMHVLPGVSKLSPSHDLLVVENMLSSVVSFLKFCPDLLLAVPDALNRLTALLEKLFPLIASGGRFEHEGTSPVGSARLSSARSSIMEAYSWLPPGSFPLSADRIFIFAANQIQELSGSDVLCSILESLVSREDKIIEAHSVERAVSPGQVGGSVTLDTNISLRASDVMHHNEREAILHLLAWRKKFRMRMHNDEYHESPILGLYLREGDENSIPTPLHEVGTWREPFDPTGTSKVRLLDSAIHVFAATFGLQEGHTQADALRMLETLYVASQTEKSNRFNVSTSLISESQGKVKPREEDVPASNMIATILSCLQALPLHESTYDTLIGVGPPWMERATSLLLRLLPSPSDIIRRGAAEGLSFLATLGVSEDAHTLQSMILHSLDEVMKGNLPGIPPKNQAETLSFARAGSLLTLACIQRAAKRMRKSEDERAISRSVSQKPESKSSDKDGPPILIMMTRVLPSLTTQNPDVGSQLVRTYALHSFGVLVSNYVSKSDKPLSPDQSQIIWKAVEAVETSFLGAWSAVVSDINKGKEREKLASEPAFLAVLLRLMTTLLPWLKHFTYLDRWIASRFSSIACSVLEWCSGHPVVLFEGTVFFERLSAHCDLVRSSSCCVSITDNSAALAMPFLLAVLQPPHAKIVADGEQDFTSCRGPLEVQRSAVMCLKGLCSSTMIPNDAFMPFEIGKTLFSFLHDRTGRRNFQHFTDQRSLALSRAVVNYFEDCQLLEAELISLISALIKVQISGREAEEQSFICMRWLLCARCLVSGDMIKPGQHFDDSEIELSIPSLIEKAKLVARCDASTALRYSNPPRWQLKCIATNVASVIMGLLLGISEANADDFSLFNYTSAQSHCNELFRKDGIRINSVQLHSCPIFHLEELVTMACSASAATSNHSELPSVQISGLRFLTSLFHAFGKQLDAATNDGASVLEQFSSQIISAVKYALKSEASRDESVSTTDFHRLFSVGCEALLVIIANGFVTDPVAMKRLLRPILLSPEEIPFAPFPTDGESGFYSISLKCGNMIDDPRSYPLFRISKLSFAARVSISIELGKIPHSTASIISGDLEQNEEGRAIHSAAAAIDGFLLHTIQRRPRDENTDGRDNIAGLTCKNYSDLDDAVVHGLVKNWPTLAAYAVTSIIKAIKSMPEEREKKDSLLAWLMKLCPIIIYGLRLTLSDFNSVQNSTSGITVSEDSSTAESLALCVYSLRLFVREHESIGNDFLCSTELCDIINILAKSVVFSFLGLPDCVDKVKSLSAGQPSSEGDGKVLMNQSCLFIEDLCRNIEVVQVDLSLLIRTVVYPLAALQEKKIKVESNNMFIVCSCIQSSQCLLRCHPEKEKGLFEKALLQLAFSILKDVSGSLVDANVPCLSLLKTCCEETSMTPEEWGQVATYTACSGLWDAWAVVCSTLPLGFGVTCSIHAVKIALADLKSSFVHTNALVALRKSLQSAAIENPAMVCSVLQCVGCEILQLLRAYSLRIVAGQDFDENRITVCAESVKVNMIAFQYLHSVSMEDSKFVSFLSAMFDVLVDCVSYNGLPNHPSGKAGADETIGKMCAQVFVHVARTTPLVFKSAMVIISVERRTILETAVRADMSGYAAPRKEPLKKKLNLKGFVR